MTSNLKKKKYFKLREFKICTSYIRIYYLIYLAFIIYVLFIYIVDICSKNCNIFILEKKKKKIIFFYNIFSATTWPIALSKIFMALKITFDFHFPID